MRKFAAMLLVSLSVVTLIGSTPARAQEAAPFDYTVLQQIMEDDKTPPETLIDIAIGLLDKELKTPSGPARAIAGGITTTSRAQEVTVGVLSHIGARNTPYLRQRRDQVTGLLRDRLIVALGYIAVQENVEDLFRIARTDPQLGVRMEAVKSLTQLTVDPTPTDIPPRIRPGETWTPLPEETKARIVALLFEMLKEPTKEYTTDEPDEERACYPMQQYAARSLREFGYEAIPVARGWRVIEREGTVMRDGQVVKEGRFVRMIVFDRGRARLPYMGNRLHG